MATQPPVGAQEVPLLRTKLYIPPARPELVPRPRLIERLNAGTRSGRKLTLVSAPAGFGKTTLVSEWIGNWGSGIGKLGNQVASQPLHSNPQSPISNPKFAWLSLDESDNDLTRFLAYLIAALQTIEADVGKGAMSALQSPQTPPAEAILTATINEITALPDRIVLVLDDYHLIDAQPIHDALTFLLRRLPPQMHLVIATREDPSLPLARLRARGQLTELRATDLRFTSSEAVAFLNQVMGLDLSAEDIAALETRTEGWIAGLQLAAISMQGRMDVTGFIQAFTGSHHFVLDYLVEEVLEQQSQSVQSFLLCTAILDRLTGSLCDALTGQEDGQQILEMLERANLFIVPLDTERHWYRYHHLFADLLRQRLRQTHPEKLPILHIRAGEWFTHQGLNREAIKHSLAARDYQGAAELIRAIAIDIIQQGGHTTVVGWINALPEEFIREQPYLGVLYAWALQLSGQLETAKARLIDAENALDSLKYQDDEDVDTILGLIHSRRAYSTFMTGELDKTISFAHQALDQLPETAALVRAQTALYLGVAYLYQGQLQAALDVYNDILPIAQTMGGKSIAVSCYLNLGDLHMEMAQLHRAKEIYEAALKLTERHTGRPDMPFTGYIYVSIGRILRQWNQVENAYRFTAKGLALCRDWKNADTLALSCIELAYIHWALGNAEQARASFLEAIQTMDSFSPWGSKYAAAHQVKFDLARGDIDAVERWVQTNDLVTDGDFEFHREIEYLSLARVFIAQKRFEEAHALIERIYRTAQEIGRKQTELEGLILLALLFSVQGETDQALVYLEKALSIGEPEGFIRIFVDEGPPMASLLYEALSRGVAPDYVRQLLTAFSIAEPGQAGPSSTPTPESDLIEPLSERELEVLQLIAEGLTNPEIASRLFLSLHTIKAHARNIYSKLGVHNRTQAVTRARALGVLPST
ncbi:MAG: LuxR C-terminal-related transcriptional regulator [Planctomycetota bacterium]|jgi:LuxR family maltose regulon positive regulatory protein